MIDLDRFLRSVVHVRNEGGGRGYESGIRVFNCPICGEERGRGWVGIEGWGAGCFNIGCDAEPGLPGGAVEWARRVLRLASRAEAWRLLERQFGGAAVAPLPPRPRGEDFCRFPAGMRDFAGAAYASVVQSVFESFMRKQWGVGPEDAARWQLGWCIRGSHSFRVVIPVHVAGVAVGFQSRTIKDGVEPKYLTSSNVASPDRPAECGRPAAAMLFNSDSLRRGREALMVEGAGDVMGWHHLNASPPAFGLLGVALTVEKISMIRASGVSRVVVALDAEPRAQARAASHVEDLRAFDVDAVLGEWRGGKSAGDGARLELSGAADSLASRASAIFGRR